MVNSNSKPPDSNSQRLQIRQELLLLQGDDGIYVLSSLTSPKSMITLLDYIQANFIPKAEHKRLVVEAREIFVPVKGAEGHYEVSNTGKVRSVIGGRRRGLELKQSPNTKGPNKSYLVVTLVKGSKSMSTTVHRLVAKAFLSNPDNKPCVNHKDGNRHNNDVSNLEWATYSENELHAYAVLGKVNSQAKLTELQVAVIRKCLEAGETGAALAKRYGVHKTLISMIKLGKHRKQLSTDGGQDSASEVTP